MPRASQRASSRRPPLILPPNAPTMPALLSAPFADKHAIITNTVSVRKRTYNEMSSTIEEQSQRLKLVEDAARVDCEQYKASIATFATHYDKARKKFKEAIKREREATQENKRLRIQLEHARNQHIRAETRLDEVTQERDRIFDQVSCAICLDTIGNMISRCGHCFCETCWNRWANTSKFVWRDDNFVEQEDKMSCPDCRQELKKTGDVFKMFSWT
jgi:Zinc finger, C3HC4 type (RING finger)